MNFYILCPGEHVTGGTELAHQLCYEINKNGQFATMYYIDRTGKNEKPQDVDTPEKFKKYCDTHVTYFDDADKEENIIVVPEAVTDWAFYFRKANVCIWWMSVDNFNYVSNDDYIKLLDSKSRYHLIQSYYAADYLRKKNISEDKLVWLSDYIGDLYRKFVFPAEYRKDVILFNPKKGFENIKKLIEKCTFIEWKPLINMTEEEMVLNMQLAKMYIDFGNHPGKDRIPREAASCGCCILTNKKGSAAFFEDVPINDEYKFDEPYDYEAIIEEIRIIMNDYENHFKNFEEYRKMIMSEKDYFEEDARGFISLFK